MKKLFVLFLCVSMSVLFFAGPGCIAERSSKQPEELTASNPFMQAAISEARKGILNGDGGPFGCVIVKDGKIVGKGHNRVLVDHDPTAHGEITAIRDAGRRLKTHDLKGCELYTTGEPCAMCLAACVWAHIDKIYYGCTLKDNSIIGFIDEPMAKFFESIYQVNLVTDNLADAVLNKVSNNLSDKIPDYLVNIDREACLDLFHEYTETQHKLY